MVKRLFPLTFNSPKNYFSFLKVWRGDGLAGSGLGIAAVSGLKKTFEMFQKQNTLYNNSCKFILKSNLWHKNCRTVGGLKLLVGVTHLHAEYYGEVRELFLWKNIMRIWYSKNIMIILLTIKSFTSSRWTARARLSTCQPSFPPWLAERTSPYWYWRFGMVFWYLEWCIWYQGCCIWESWFLGKLIWTTIFTKIHNDQHHHWQHIVNRHPN